MVFCYFKKLFFDFSSHIYLFILLILLCYFTTRYTPEFIGLAVQDAIEMGVPAACRKWSPTYPDGLPESTLRNWVSKHKALSVSGQLTKSSSQSLFKRMNYVKRKVTRTARNPPSDPSGWSRTSIRTSE